MGLTVREHLVLAHRAHFERHRCWSDFFSVRALFPPSSSRPSRWTPCWSCSVSRRSPRPRCRSFPSGWPGWSRSGGRWRPSPAVVLLDEPLSGLDVRATEKLTAAFEPRRGEQCRRTVAAHGRTRRRVGAGALQQDLRAQLRRAHRAGNAGRGPVGSGRPGGLPRGRGRHGGTGAGSGGTWGRPAPMAVGDLPRGSPRHERAHAGRRGPRRELRRIASALRRVARGGGGLARCRAGRQRSRQEHVGPSRVRSGALIGGQRPLRRDRHHERPPTS